MEKPYTEMEVTLRSIAKKINEIADYLALDNLDAAYAEVLTLDAIELHKLHGYHLSEWARRALREYMEIDQYERDLR